jgi:hypothetical protein
VLHPALKLTSAPARAVEGLAVGEAFRFAPHSSTSLGSGPEVAVHLAGPNIRPLHATVTFAHGHARVRSVDGAQVWVDDKPLAGTGGGPYGPGARLRLPDGIEFELVEAVEVRDAALEARLLTEADTATWRVYADRLEEGGDPLGAWMSSNPSAEMLPVLRAAPAALLLVDLSYGLITRATLDTTAEMTWRSWLEELLQTPYARLLSSLEVVCVDEALGPSERGERVNQVIDSLLTVRQPPPLRTLRLGAAYQWTPGDDVVALYRTLQTHVPTLQTPLERLVETRNIGRLDVIEMSEGWHVAQHSLWLVAGRTAVAEALGATGPLSMPDLVIERRMPGYKATASSPVRHREQQRMRFSLNDGDLVQLGGLRMRFSLHTGLPSR